MLLVRRLSAAGYRPMVKYYYTDRSQGTATGKYVYYAVNELTNMINKYSESSEKQQAIEATLDDTLQNCFHFVLSKKVVDRQHHPAGTYFVTWEVIDKHGSIWNSGFTEHDNHNLSLLVKNHKQVLEFFEPDSQLKVIEPLLVPYEKDDHALVRALTAKDKQGNTPLHYLHTGAANGINITPLLKRISPLNSANKERLLSEKNNNEKTILHVFVEQPGEEAINYIKPFGENIAHHLVDVDAKGNTVWSYILSNSHTQPPLNLVKYFCALLKPAQPAKPSQEQKAPDYLRMFGENLAGLNPLHNLCQGVANNSKREIFQELENLLPHDFLVTKIMQLDRDNLTLIHHAMKSKNYDLAKQMLKHLPPEQQKEILLKPETNGYPSMLHYMCDYGDLELLEQAITILGPKEFYKLYDKYPLKFSSSNKSMTADTFNEAINKYRKLFNCFDYFIQTFDNDKKTFNQQKNYFNERYKDFFGCLTAIAMDSYFPPAPDSFYAKTQLPNVFKLDSSEKNYMLLRFALSQGVTAVEWQDFVAFIQEQAAPDDCSELFKRTSLLIKSLTQSKKSNLEEKDALQPFSLQEDKQTFTRVDEFTDGSNEFHILAKSIVNDDYQEVFEKLFRDTCEKVLPLKMMKCDRDGLTPLHYALMSGKQVLAKKILETLTLSQQIAMIAMKTYRGDTILHYICQYGNRELLETAIKIIGPKELYRIRCENPLKFCASNQHNIAQVDFNNAIKNSNKLFDCFKYFEDKYDNSKTSDNQSPSFTERFKDFHACVTALQQKLPLPDNNKFYAKKHGFWQGTQKYQNLKFALSSGVTQEEMADFKKFIDEKAVVNKAPGLLAAPQKASKTTLVAWMTKVELGMKVEDAMQTAGAAQSAEQAASPPPSASAPPLNLLQPS